MAVEPEWRREVSNKLQDYRIRRRGSATVDLQTPLPFDPDPQPAIERSRSKSEVARPPSANENFGARPQRNERFEISIPNPETVPAAGQARRPVDSPHQAGIPHAPFCAVASLPERRRAATVDVALLLFSYGGMLALFTVLGGHIGLNKIDLLVAGATFALFYAQYFALFTIFGGSTPGMMLRGLRVASFDGGIPTSRQMMWRSLGYLISAGTCFLGFLWALWDDDQLCWQDRISQTYLTPIEEITPY